MINFFFTFNFSQGNNVKFVVGAIVVYSPATIEGTGDFFFVCRAVDIGGTVLAKNLQISAQNSVTVTGQVLIFYFI